MKNNKTALLSLLFIPIGIGAHVCMINMALSPAGYLFISQHLLSTILGVCAAYLLIITGFLISTASLGALLKNTFTSTKSTLDLASFQPKPRLPLPRPSEVPAPLRLSSSERNAKPILQHRTTSGYIPEDSRLLSATPFIR